MLFYSLLLSALVANASVPPKLMVEGCEFPDTYEFNIGECDVVFSNQSETPIHVSRFMPVRPDDRVEPGDLVIPPHSKAYVRARMNTGNALGQNDHHAFHFHSDEPGHEARGFSTIGFVNTVLDQAKPEVAFGVVDAEAKPPTKHIRLSSDEAPGFRISKIIEKPSFVDVTVDDTGRGVTLTMRADAQWGLHAEYLKLAIDTPQQKEAWVLVRADVHGDVVPASNPFDLGLMRFGDKNEFRIRLTSRTGRDFRVGDITLEKFAGSTALEQCVPIAAGCREIRLKISDEQRLGAVEGKMLVDLPELQQRLAIAVWGLILAKDTKVHSIDLSSGSPQESQADGSIQSPASAISKSGSVDLATALKDEVGAAKKTDLPGSGPLLKWTVTNATTLHGFQIFRAASENGPFALMNKTSILVNVENNGPASFQWRDATAESGKTYWYYIGLVYTDGHKEHLTAPQKVVAK